MRQYFYAILALILGGSMFVVAPMTPPAQAAPPKVIYDGSSPDRAAASCWQIKQDNSRAASGVYWLYTPKLAAPQQFYCEQSYQGGGWVLVGKGRETWEEHYHGNGNLDHLLNGDALLNAPAAQYSAGTIDGLLNGTRVDSLQDGILLRRSANVSGSSQNFAQFQFRDRDRWTWAFGAPHRLAWYSFNGKSKTSGGSLPLFSKNSSDQMVNFSSLSMQNWTLGWAYGSSMRRGSTSSSSHLYTAVGTAPRPMTWMYIRPELRQSHVTSPAIPDTGTQEVTNRAVASSFAARGQWGVTGLLVNTKREGDVEAQAFAQIGNTMYVGGNFKYVQRGSSGERISQAALAAFDASTGEFIRSFTPTFNHQVKSLEALPDGTLLVGGQFSTVNGQHAPAIVKLDAQTGEIAEDWTLDLEQRVSGGIRLVRSLGVDGDWVYVGGSFTHFKSNPDSHAVYSRNHGRFNWRTGKPDPVWNPEFNGGVVDTAVDPQTQNVYVGGYFDRSRGESAFMVAAFDVSDDSVLNRRPWNFIPSHDRGTFQQAMGVTNAKVYVGGAQHSLFGYDQKTLTRQSGSITRQGGDMQTIVATDEVVYAGCHCGNYAFQDAYKYELENTWTQADRIKWIGAWDAATGDFIPEFNPPFLGSKNAGAWGSYVAEDGTLWVGGDFTGARTTQETTQWVGGFVRFPLVDHAAPTVPVGFIAESADAGTVSLRWLPSDDDQTTPTYEILRGDRVIAVTGSTRITVPRGGSDRFFVRAIDEAGNRSASTAVVELGPQGEVPQYDGPEVLWNGSTWDYWYQIDAPSSDWNAPHLSDPEAPTGPGESENTSLPEGWNQARAPFGTGSSISLETVLTESFDQGPAALYARKTVDLSDRQDSETIEISTWADDGIVVYVNGTEVHRAGMEEGAVGHNTFAHAAISSAQAVADPVIFEVPRSVLLEGENTIAVSIHANYRNTPNISFDMSAQLIDATLPLEPDPEPDTEAVNWSQEAWDYWYDAEAPDSDWNAPSANIASGDAPVADDGWNKAVAPFGYGNSIPLETVVEPTSDTRPPVLYARRDFTVAELPQDHTVQLQTWADDGLVVYLNGNEIARERMAAGSVHHGTYAHAAISSANAQADPVLVTIPPELLQDGTNTLAVSVHANYRATPNLTFGMTTDFVAYDGTADPGPVDPGSEDPNPQDPFVWSGPALDYWYDDEPPVATWNSPATDGEAGEEPQPDADSPWSQAIAPFGFGNSIPLATTLTHEFESRPASLYARREFTVDQLPADAVIRLEAWADDGLVLYLNGVELTRQRMAPGQVGHHTFAHAAISSANAVAEPVIVDIPVSDFADGVNVLAASIHANYRATPNLSFGLEATILEPELPIE